MNKEFVKKMIKAERLRYEAIKEILPENLRKRVNSYEKEAADFLKDIALELVREEVAESKKDTNTSVKKVNIE